MVTLTGFPCYAQLKKILINIFWTPTIWKESRGYLARNVAIPTLKNATDMMERQK